MGGVGVGGGGGLGLGVDLDCLADLGSIVGVAAVVAGVDVLAVQGCTADIELLPVHKLPPVILNLTPLIASTPNPKRNLLPLNPTQTFLSLSLPLPELTALWLWL